MLSELARTAARQAVQDRLYQVEAELNTQSADYENQVEPLRQQIEAYRLAFETQTANLSSEREALQADLNALDEGTAG